MLLVRSLSGVLLEPSARRRSQPYALILRDSFSRGIHAGPNICLFKQVRALQLRGAPVFENMIPKLNAEAVASCPSNASWISIGMVLAAYGLSYDRRDDLITFGEETTLLPIRRCWLLYLGIIGRYGARKDRD